MLLSRIYIYIEIICQNQKRGPCVLPNWMWGRTSVGTLTHTSKGTIGYNGKWLSCRRWCDVSTLVVIIKTLHCLPVPPYSVRGMLWSKRKNCWHHNKCHVGIRWSYLSYCIPLGKASKLKSCFLHGLITLRTVFKQFTYKRNDLRLKLPGCL